MNIVIVIICIGSVIANVGLVAIVAKLYTEYWKDITIKRRYESKSK